jgi:SAM-dependent MidA family methyltransferase
VPLVQIIIEKIRTQGPLSFYDFMDMALYYPGQGYYCSPKDKIGQTGDFYTSPSLTSLFGELIAGQLEEMWLVLDRPSFTVVECGAGTGLLCRDILQRLRKNTSLFQQLDYVLVERSDKMREKEQELLASSAEHLLRKVRWASSVRDLPPVTGCILSNELLDNLPVHLVEMGDQLMEVFVGYDDGFKEVLRPAADELKAYLDELHMTLPKGFRGEICLQAVEWIHDVSATLKKGFVITIDYGNAAGHLYNNREGTLVCYHQHKVNHSPYEFIGQQDITSHVNFSALDHWGRLGGLQYCGYTSQARFLQGLGLNRALQQLERAGIAHTTKRQLYTLLVEMGNQFKVLIQRKGLGRTFLSGLQFSDVLA